MAFQLDPQLAAGAIVVGDLILSRVLLKNDSRRPWIILAPRRPALTELGDLAAPERSILMEEIAAASSALRDLYRPSGVNVATQVDDVAQLHVHVIARQNGEPAWPQAQREDEAPARYGAEAAQAAASALAARLGVA
jgi:diadenosine tetraphosphate (Ap4A) HIT family hydrolase